VDRRAFLRNVVAAVSLPTLGAVAAACTGRSSAPTDASPSASSSLPSLPARRSWSALGDSLDGELILPGAPGYPTARLAYDPRFDAVRPRAVVMAASPADVANTIRFARDRDLPFAARCGGHSYGGYSSSDGIVIDVSPMAAVRSLGGDRATIGAGAKMIDVAAGLAPAGRVVPGGSCVTVGVAGLTLGGGQGVIGRRFGLTCDSLEAATVVLADGRVVACDRSTEPDLFWALRGGGGGNFGVVTSFTFTTHALDRLTSFSMAWPWSDAVDVFDAWQGWAPDADDRLWSTCRLRSIPGSGPQISVAGAWTGSPDALAEEIRPLTSAAGGPIVSTRTQSYLDAVKYDGGCAGASTQACHLAIRGGSLPRQTALARSDFFDRSMDRALIATVAAAVERRSADVTLRQHTGGVLFDAWGGAVTRIAGDASAFPHRQARYLAQEFVTLNEAPSGKVEREERAWLDAFWHELRPAASGAAYVNYIDADLRGWQRAYYGDNLARLMDVKRAYDPDDVFRFAQSIPLRA
jgi:FAD/FMN-containing dehydrogenase